MEEDAGVITLPVLRLHGTYGHVSADFSSRGFSAVPGGYVLHGSSVTFQHGQNLSFINVSIIDDNGRLVLQKQCTHREEEELKTIFKYILITFLPFPKSF